VPRVLRVRGVGLQYCKSPCKSEHGHRLDDRARQRQPARAGRRVVHVGHLRGHGRRVGVREQPRVVARAREAHAERIWQRVRGCVVKRRVGCGVLWRWRTVEPRRRGGALALRLDLARVELDAKVGNLARAGALEQVAPSRLVNVREGGGALEGESTADGVGVRIVQLRRRLAERLARGDGHARDAALAVKLHDLGGDELVGHAHVVLAPLQQPPALADTRGVDLLLGGREQVAQDGVVLAERVDQRVGLLDRGVGVLLPLLDVGLARGLVRLQVAQTLALPPEAGRGRRVLHDAHGWRRGVGEGDVGEAGARAALLIQHAAREQAARALLGLGAVHRVGGDVQPVVGEARQRQARLGVLCRVGWGLGCGAARAVLGACVGSNRCYAPHSTAAACRAAAAARVGEERS